MNATQTNPDMIALPPGELPISHMDWRADPVHLTKGRAPYKLPRYIIVHSTVGRDSRAWLTTTSPPPFSNVSAHVLVQGNERYNLVDFLDTAYHAGSCLPGISNANSLGIEIENLSGAPDGHGGLISEPYSAATINNAAHCVAAWSYSYGIPLANVRRHADVATYPADYPDVALRGKLGRKHDPVGLDWHDFMNRVQAWLLFFAALPQAEHAHYIELAAGTNPFDTPQAVFGPPTGSQATFEGALNGSPALQDGAAADYWRAALDGGCNPFLMLAIYNHESHRGTDLGSTIMRESTRNPGALRPHAGEPSLAIGVSPSYFRIYDTWLNGWRDMAGHLHRYYEGKKPSEIFSLWAPKTDHNDPVAYTLAVLADLARWAS